jgi:predicted dehydrogenase
MTWNIAFYGAGDRARPYLDALGRQADVAVTGVCDLDRRAAEQTAAGWAARVYLSYEAMLEEARPDALWICVPPHLQGDVLLKAAERGIPFFIDAPGAVDYERARVYGRRVREANLVTAVGFPCRYADIVQEAREYLGAHPIPLALGWWLGPPEDPPAASAAGLLWTDACRLVDALRFFCGEVARVRALSAGSNDRASVGRIGNPSEQPDGLAIRPTSGGLVVQMELAAGGVGMLTCATFARPEPRIELELLGEGWSIRFGPKFGTLRLAESDKTTELRCLNNAAGDQVGAFLNAVAAGDPAAVLVDYAEALRTLAVCQAATLSAHEGRPVAVAELEQEVPSPIENGTPQTM